MSVHDGGGGKYIKENSFTSPRAYSVQHDIDAALAQTAYAKMRRNLAHEAITRREEGKRPSIHTTGVFRFAKEMCKQQASDPFRTLTPNQRAALIRIVGEDNAEKIRQMILNREQAAVHHTAALPKRPPGALFARQPSNKEIEDVEAPIDR